VRAVHYLTYMVTAHNEENPASLPKNSLAALPKRRAAQVAGAMPRLAPTGNALRQTLRPLNLAGRQTKISAEK